jgi:hypothetical protein
MSSAAVHDRAAGPKGWNAQQGFYVYRNRRLIIAGSWLDLGFRQEEHYKLARILVDLPNSMDEEWQVDVRKAHATPPPSLLGPLRRIARLTRQRASEVYRHRGQVLRRKHASAYQLVWRKRALRGKDANRTIYVINREHPLIREALEVGRESRQTLVAILELLENTLPVDAILVDNAEDPDSLARPDTWESAEALQKRGLDLFRAFIEDGLSPEEAYRQVTLVEPFDRAPRLLALIEDLVEVARTRP